MIIKSNNIWKVRHTVVTPHPATVIMVPAGGSYSAVGRGMEISFTSGTLKSSGESNLSS